MIISGLGLGIGLLLLALASTDNSLRSPGIDSEENTNFETGIELPPEDALPALQRRDDETDVEFLHRATNVVHRSIAHHWPPKIADSPYRARVPLTENWILWACGSISTTFNPYEFFNAEKAIQRGFGMCSQHARALTDALLQEEIDAEYVRHFGHQMVQAHTPNGTYVLDSDFNVVIPYSTSTLKENPELVKDYYADKAPVRNPEDSFTLDDLADIYSRDYILWDISESAYRRFERASYVLLWVIPAVLILLGIAGLLNVL